MSIYWEEQSITTKYIFIGWMLRVLTAGSTKGETYAMLEIFRCFSLREAVQAGKLANNR